MSATSPVSALDARPQWPATAVFARNPQWWALALSGAAWLLMISGAAHSHHGMHDATHELVAWMVMSVAMMVPMVAGSIRLSAQRSFWRRRHRAAAGFLTGYLACWLLVGVAVLLLPLRAGPAETAIAFVVAAVWQLTPWKRRALVACHWRMPLAPRGWRADRDCLRFGWGCGLRCFVSCWALMLACFLSGHALAATAAGAAVGLAERYLVRDQRLLAAALVVAGIVCGGR